MPIIVGGTHYYIQSLIWNSLLDLPSDVKPDRNDNLETKTTEELYSILQSVDPMNVHHPNQRKKIISDLRLYYKTSIPPSQLRREQNDCREKGEQLDNLVIWLFCNHETLNKRLSKRVDSMIQAGMLEENLSFITKNFNKCDHDRGVWQAIGLKEFVPLFENSDSQYNGRMELKMEGLVNILILKLREGGKGSCFKSDH